MDTVQAISQAKALNGADVYAHLSDCGVLKISGPDAQTLLQGQLTADISLLDCHRHSLSAWCTPKGRTLMLGRLFRREGAIHYLLPTEQTAACLQRLSLYVLRSKVELSNISTDLTVFGLGGARIKAYFESEFKLRWPGHNETSQADDITLLGLGQDSPHAILVLPAKNWPALNAMIRARTQAREVSNEAWRLVRIETGEPWLVPDLSEQFLPQMLNLDKLDGVSFDKGCYVGQEIVARTQYLGRLKRRLFKARINTEEAPQPGDAIYAKADLALGSADRAAGTIVESAVAPNGDWAVLAVINIDDAARPLHLRHVLGAELRIEELP